MQKIINDWDVKDILSLCFLKELKNKTIFQILQKYHSLREFLEAKEVNILAPTLKFSNIKNEFIQYAEKQIEICEKKKFKILTFWDELYPSLLKKIAYPPIVLFYKGALQQADSIAIAIVGTRKATTYGKLVAEKFAETFANHNIIVCSGLANGIDTYAHLSTIKNKGITYAVIGNGLDTISSYYAKQNADKIVAEGGAIISEYPCGTKAKPAFFPQRNRIIAGISLATIVIEAGEKSGALITANFAFNENRDVFAVSGNINSDKSKGTNALIHDSKAKIALNPEQVLNELGLISNEILPKNRKIEFTDPIEEKIYNLLNSEPMNVDKIIELSNLEISEVLVALLNLEFRKLIRQLPGKNYIREF